MKALSQPLFASLRGYDKAQLGPDLFSGALIALLSIPISMGYAQLAGLPPVYGLYGSLVPILLFAMLSTTREFIFGVDAAPAAMIGAVVTSLGVTPGGAEAMRVVPVLTLYVALWLAVFALVRADKAVDYISEPVMGGFISGVCCEIILMQVPKLLGSGTDPMELINGKLIPALDSVGAKFEKGTIFLPQLIQSAGAAQAAFDVVKKAISERGGSGVSAGKVVLCTVKGDIHDIGKNIVKTLLENYGFDVIDLGKDVDYQTVVDAAIKYDVRLVGLSALMTTTLKSMENTIKLLRENNVNCKVVVGGAVLTPEYAEKIGADYYARDAKETVDIARAVYSVNG